MCQLPLTAVIPRLCLMVKSGKLCGNVDNSYIVSALFLYSNSYTIVTYMNNEQLSMGVIDMKEQSLCEKALAQMQGEMEAWTDTAASKVNAYGPRSAHYKEKTVHYLCDGNVPDCEKTFCYIIGGECRHTTSASHALNKDDRHFVSDESGNLWETHITSNEELFLHKCCSYLPYFLSTLSLIVSIIVYCTIS